MSLQYVTNCSIVEKGINMQNLQSVTDCMTTTFNKQTVTDCMTARFDYCMYDLLQTVSQRKNRNKARKRKKRTHIALYRLLQTVKFYGSWIWIHSVTDCIITKNGLKHYIL